GHCRKRQAPRAASGRPSRTSPMPEADLRPLIEAAFADRQLLKDPRYKTAVTDTLAALDKGELRVCTQRGPGQWDTHAWLKQAVLLYFGISEMTPSAAGPIHFYDKIPLKSNLEQAGVRVV